MGGKCFVLEQKGLFLMEPGPGTLRTIACTHAGSGQLIAYDGIPNENGFFPDHEMPADHPEYHCRNGRPIYRANPVVMGSWMLDAGFLHGLTIFVVGDQLTVNCVASVVWMPFVARKRA